MYYDDDELYVDDDDLCIECKHLMTCPLTNALHDGLVFLDGDIWVDGCDFFEEKPEPHLKLLK